MTRRRSLLVIGTRPEGIKLAPLALELRGRPDEFETLVCTTGQHREMLEPVLNYFGVEVDARLSPAPTNASMAASVAGCLEQLDSVLEWCRPACVVAQGDTNSVLAASLAAFYRKIPLVHVEAGLRTGDMFAPWPEEMNRCVASLAAGLHCAPSPAAARNLLIRGFDAATVHVTGNTVIDALLQTQRRESGRVEHWQRRFPQIGDRDVVLVTAHRRENHGAGLRNICTALQELSRRFANAEFVFPVHLNPQVQAPVHELLGGLSNVTLLPPLDYPEFVWLLDRCRLVLTDSGGVQEEAPALGKQVIVLRDATERPEAVAAGWAEVAGADDPAQIVAAASRHLSNVADEASIARPAFNPYGDGLSSRRIADLMRNFISPRSFSTTTDSRTLPFVTAC